MAAKLKKGDKVIVLAGKDKGKEGEIIKVTPKTGKAVVEGINIAIRHVKQSQNKQGGKIPQAMPILTRISACSAACAVRLVWRKWQALICITRAARALPTL